MVPDEMDDSMWVMVVKLGRVVREVRVVKVSAGKYWLSYHKQNEDSLYFVRHAEDVIKLQSHRCQLVNSLFISTNSKGQDSIKDGRHHKALKRAFWPE